MAFFDIAFLSWIYWNPDRVIFTLPYLDHPVVWYGVWFVAGFIAGYFLLIHLFQQQGYSKADSLFLVDRLSGYVVFGALVGARLGHVLFYDWPIFKENWLSVFKIWEGGLASHGGAIGILVALYLYQKAMHKKFPKITFLFVLDSIVVPTAFAGFCIRIGNFFNQEVLGNPSSMPWAILFGDPMDGSLPVPRHPVQLYEAFSYFFLFLFLCSLWKKVGNEKRSGMMSGVFFVLLFGMRFLLEFFKAPQSLILDESSWQTGQLLSIPFIVAGLYLIVQSLRYSSGTAKKA